MMSPRTVLWACLGIWVCLSACKPDTPAKQSNAIDRAALFVCEPIRRADGELAFAVYTQVADSKMKLLDLARCEIVPPADYAKLNIPVEADAAVGGLQAESEYLYARQQADTLYYYYAPDSAQSDSPTPSYIRIAAFYGGQFKLLHPLSPYDLVGLYACQRPDSAYVLSLQMQAEQLVGQLFVRPGKLPSPDALQQELSSFSPQPVEVFDFQMYKLRLESSLFVGRISWQAQRSTLQLNRRGTSLGFKFEQVH